MSNPGAVGVVATGGETTEEQAAREWGLDRGFGTVDPLELADGVPETIDALWWHRDRAVAGDDPDALAVADAVERHLRDGGGLLLTGRAVEAVVPLGIDPVGPREAGIEHHGEASGLLVSPRFVDHPAVDGIDGLRVWTTPPETDVPFARYGGLLPAHGEVLASALVGEHERHHAPTAVGWRVGDGSVLGIGGGLSFAQPSAATDPARDALLENALAALADGTASTGLTGRPKTAEELAAMREALAADHHRPRYHVTPPANWLNDPNGLIEHEGTYHVFYQYNPGGPYHDAIHWGHATSEDLVHWRDEPVALTPSPEGPDRDGCWSGCAVDDDGIVRLLYTGGRDRVQLPCLATATDDTLRSFRKHPDNPIVDAVPTEPAILSTDHWEAEFRDHCVWREGDSWYQLIGSGIEGVGGTALLYTADELTEWRYEGPILSADGPDAGAVWECPELLGFSGGDLLHVSNYEDVRYFLGRFDGERFHVDRSGLLDHGDFYAPQSMETSDGRTLTWGWLTEARDVSAQWRAGWSGALSIPRELDVVDGELRQRPARELAALRGDATGPTGLTLDAGDRHDLAASGRAVELRLRVRLVDAEELRLTVFESPDGEERTPIRYTRGSELVVDRASSSCAPEATADAQRMTVRPTDGSLDLRVFLDGSTIELFANGTDCLTSRVYPTREDATGLSLAAVGGRAVVDEVTVWELGDGWERPAEPRPTRTD